MLRSLVASLRKCVKTNDFVSVKISSMHEDTFESASDDGSILDKNACPDNRSLFFFGFSDSFSAKLLRGLVWRDGVEGSGVEQILIAGSEAASSDASLVRLAVKSVSLFR